VLQTCGKVDEVRKEKKKGDRGVEVFFFLKKKEKGCIKLAGNLELILGGHQGKPFS
jgi:hypothetical protein